MAIKSGCNFSDTPGQPNGDYSHMWNDNFIEYVETGDVGLVVAPGTQMISRPAEESVAEGAQDRWATIKQTATSLLLIRGLIRSGGVDGAADCLVSGNDPEECGGMIGDAYQPNPLENADLGRAPIRLI